MGVVSFQNQGAALNAQRRLGQVSDGLSRIYERLSTGQRINRASDDAAGLAIADSLRADARVFGTAIRYVNDGVSLLNIVSSTLSEQTNILQRLGELAEQSANGTFSNTQRSSLNLEFQQLGQEYDRLASTTNFNGIYPFLASTGR